MSRREEHHVVPSDRGGWDVKRENSKRASAHVRTKTEAVKIGRQLSENQGTELIIHNEDGTIRSSESHNNNSNSQRNR